MRGYFEKFAGEFKNEAEIEEEFDDAGLDYNSEEREHYDTDFLYENPW